MRKTLLSVLLLAVSTTSTAGCPARSTQPSLDGAAPPADPDREIGKCCGSAGECVTGHCTHAPLLNNLKLCSKPCSTNPDCPALSGCQRIGDGAGGFRSVCLPCEIVANTNERFCPLEAGSFTCFLK